MSNQECRFFKLHLKRIFHSGKFGRNTLCSNLRKIKDLKDMSKRTFGCCYHEFEGLNSLFYIENQLYLPKAPVKWGI
jgi:hypothetical protein